MSDFYSRLAEQDRIKLLEKILPMEMQLREMAEFCKTAGEFGLNATFTETRTRLLVERHHLMSGLPSLAAKLSREGQDFLKLLRQNDLKNNSKNP